MTCMADIPWRVRKHRPALLRFTLNQMIPETPLQARLSAERSADVEPTNGQPIVLVDSFVAEPRPQMSLVA